MLEEPLPSIGGVVFRQDHPLNQEAKSQLKESAVEVEEEKESAYFTGTISQDRID